MPEPVSITLLTTSVIAGLVRYAKRKFQQVKPVFDVIAASLLLIILSPVMGLAAVLVRLFDGSPIFYGQIRVGKDGQLFQMYKFRTMPIDVESATGPIWAAEEDPRATRLGRILRKTHVDELPQLINVIKGEMSLVGPRPERPHFVEQLTDALPEYPKRLSVKPGITGLAQVNHGAEQSITDTQQKLRFDLMYIDSMSWGTDFRILLATLGKVKPQKFPESGQMAHPTRQSLDL
jgi:lipopolysaccharide/colanic/teichoic acid biosynthesis glycosyltransferase